MEFDDITLWADDMVELTNESKVSMLKSDGLSYQDGAAREIASNFLIHLSETPNT